MDALSWCSLGVQCLAPLWFAPLWKFRAPGLCHRGLPARSLSPWPAATMSSDSGHR